MEFTWMWRNMKAAHGTTERIDILREARAMWPEPSDLIAVHEGDPGVLEFMVKVENYGVTVSANDHVLEERPKETMRELHLMAVNLVASKVPDLQ